MEQTDSDEADLFYVLQCESKNTPLRFSDILNNFLHTYYTFLSTLDYTFLFSYL